ncbi:MAG TPA: hypothetical protein VF595_04985 [Tepidisphaeraceae bacterium]|jgi:hypothetical protein
MDDNVLSLLITVGAALAFLLSAWATFWIWRGRHGGWARLAAAYPAKGRRDAPARRWQSLTMRPARVAYPGLITLRLTVDGLHAVPLLPVRFGHEPILVPWDDIEIIAVDTYPADRLYDLKFAKVPQVHARVNVTVAQFIRRAADNSHYFADAMPFAGRKSLPAPTPKPVLAARQSVA